MFPGNILLDHTNLFFPNNYQMNDAIQIFISVINVLREYHEMKEDIKNCQNALKYTI